MKAWEIILIVACVAIVVGVVVATIVRKVKGKSSCGCDCESCGLCCHCTSQPDNDNVDKTTK